MGSIPLVITEEHHESLLVWAHAIERGRMPAAGNTLLHVDEHADWFLPRARRALPQAPAPAADIARLVYGDLKISDFIWVAVYQGLFDRVCWLRRQHRVRGPQRHRRLYVCPKDSRGLRLFTGTCLADGSIPAILREGARAVDYDLFEPEDLLEPEQSLELMAPVVLSLDLDYFASHTTPHHPSHRIEVTAAEFRSYCEDPYHLLRISPGGQVTPTEEDGRYYFAFNTAGDDAPDTRETAFAALDRFGELLAAAPAPVLITLSRSLKSGYTPPALAAELEAALLDRLAALYELEPLPLEAIWADIQYEGLRLEPEEKSGVLQGA